MRNSRAALSLAACIALCLPAFLSAQDVNRKEIESTKGKTIEFVNYVGPHKVVDTKAQIRAIGQGMGSAVSGGAKQSGDLARYGVIHAVDPSVKTGFDADILYLGKGAGVDHVRNLRWIIAGYLEKAYGYSAADADTLAFFITIYNAVYRGDTDYFASRYKKVVTGYLTKDNAGLSMRWDEWADKSRIVIPLGADAATGNVSAVSTTKLTEEKVTEELRKTPGSGVDERKDIVGIKEKEVQQGEKTAAAKQAEADKADAQLAADKAKLEADKKALDDRKAAAAEADKAAADKAASDKAAGVTAAVDQKGTDAEAAKAAKDKEQQAIADQEKAVAVQEKSVAEQQTAVDAKKADAAQAQNDVTTKKEEISSDRQKIAEDQQKAINSETTGAAGVPEKAVSKGTFIEALSLSQPWARLLSLNLESGGTLGKSELNTIHIGTLVKGDNAYYCIAGSTIGTGAVRLTSVNADTLVVAAEGKDDISAGSFLVLQDGSLYAVVIKAGRYYLGRFGSDLKLLAQSEQPVHPFTALEFRPDGAVVQLAEGGFAFLDKDSLKQKKVLK
jgi:hypothetical protein